MARALKSAGIDTLKLPYFSSPNNSAVGCYLNFLETEKAVFLPIFGAEKDDFAVAKANALFSKHVVPVELSAIAKKGGCLNCTGWEWEAVGF